MDEAGLTLEYTQQLAVGRVPQLYGAVLVAGEEPSAVAREPDCCHRRRVDPRLSAKCAQQCASGGVPQLHAAVQATGRDPGAIRRKRDRGEGALAISDSSQ